MKALVCYANTICLIELNIQVAKDGLEIEHSSWIDHVDTTSGQLGGISEQGDCASAGNPGASLLQGPLSGKKRKGKNPRQLFCNQFVLCDLKRACLCESM